MVFIRVIPKVSHIGKCPDEILTYISSFLDDQDVVNLTSTCKRFHKLKVRDESRYNLWNSTYPKLWTIPEDIISETESNTEITLEESQIALEYLQSLKVDIRRGDFIEFKVEMEDQCGNEGLAIYDGKQIVNLDRKYSEGCLPSQFKAIDEFPINYFHVNCFNKVRCIDYNFIIWFDHKPYLDQILANIKCDDKLCSEKTVYTHFIHKNGRKYYIVLCDEHFFTFKRIASKLKPEALASFKQTLSQDEICFSSDDEYLNGLLPERKLWSDQKTDVLFIDHFSTRSY